MENINGRTREISLLEKYMASSKAEFIAIYGRRRIGKTFLVNRLFEGRMAFSMTGVLEGSFNDQIDAFMDALDLYGYNTSSRPERWMQAFSILRKVLTPRIQSGEPCIVFLDEIPCLDTHTSGFAKALGHFWNSWGVQHDNLKLIVCGSATTWMLKNLIDSHGGLHNRLTHELKLEAFDLHDTEQYLLGHGFEWSRHTIIQTYMFTGGVAYYLSLLDNTESLAQNIDRLYFSEIGELRREYKRLMHTLFTSPESYIRLIEMLAVKREGMTRGEIIEQLGINPGGTLSDQLNNLQECGFVRSYNIREKKVIKQKGAIYQLTDMFTLFHLSFYNHAGNDGQYWFHNIGTPKINTWLGLAFERICMIHSNRIKAALHIDGISSQQYAWRSKTSKPAVQIDMIIDRADQTANICEIKYSENDYFLSEEEASKMRLRLECFRQENHPKENLLLTLITAAPLHPNAASNSIPIKLDGNALF